ncbi:connectin-like [Ixodes scapularis]
MEAREKPTMSAHSRRPRHDLPAVCKAYLTLFLIFLTATFQAGASEAEDLVPNLCNLIDQALYCRCDTDDITDDATEVTCYVVKDIAEDDIVFKAFAKQPSIVSIVFSSLSEDHHLKFVPSDVLPHAPVLERLKFSQAELGVLKTHAFYNLTKLAVLSLDSNEITELETDCISHLPRLKKLELADNKLKKMPARALSHLPSLTHLFLERNKMTVIEDFAFAGLGKVKELDLSDNSIEALTEHSFKGLSRVLRLDMFRNKLKRLGARVFGGLSSLVELDLKYNEISEVDPLAFDGLPHLTIVYLSFNRLRVLPAHMFMGAPNLVTVDLSQNQLVTLTWRTVQDLRKIDAESFDMSLTAARGVGTLWFGPLSSAVPLSPVQREKAAPKLRPSARLVHKFGPRPLRLTQRRKAAPLFSGKAPVNRVPTANSVSPYEYCSLNQHASGNRASIRTFLQKRKILMGRDQRLKRMVDLLTSVRLVKMCAWEDAYMDSVKRLRETEMTPVFRVNLLDGLIDSLYSGTSSMVQ